MTKTNEKITINMSYFGKYGETANKVLYTNRFGGQFIKHNGKFTSLKGNDNIFNVFKCFYNIFLFQYFLFQIFLEGLTILFLNILYSVWHIINTDK